MYDRPHDSSILSCKHHTAPRASLITSLPRFYVTHSSEGPQDDDPAHSTSTAETYLKLLESAASAPQAALEHTQHDKLSQEERMKRAFNHIFVIIMYLGRPQDEEAASVFLDTFEKAPASPGSDLSRARKATTYLISMVVRDLASIPFTSILRADHADLFAIFGALEPLYDAYNATADTDASADPEINSEDSVRLEQLRAWSGFWSRTQPILLALGMKLDENGFGHELEE